MKYNSLLNGGKGYKSIDSSVLVAGLDGAKKESHDREVSRPRSHGTVVGSVRVSAHLFDKNVAYQQVSSDSTSSCHQNGSGSRSKVSQRLAKPSFPVPRVKLPTPAKSTKAPSGLGGNRTRNIVDIGSGAFKAKSKYASIDSDDEPELPRTTVESNEHKHEKRSIPGKARSSCSDSSQELQHVGMFPVAFPAVSNGAGTATSGCVDEHVSYCKVRRAEVGAAQLVEIYPCAMRCDRSAGDDTVTGSHGRPTEWRAFADKTSTSGPSSPGERKESEPGDETGWDTSFDACDGRDFFEDFPPIHPSENFSYRWLKVGPAEIDADASCSISSKCRESETEKREGRAIEIIHDPPGGETNSRSCETVFVDSPESNSAHDSPVQEPSVDFVHTQKEEESRIFDSAGAGEGSRCMHVDSSHENLPGPQVQSSSFDPVSAAGEGQVTSCADTFTYGKGSTDISSQAPCQEERWQSEECHETQIDNALQHNAERPKHEGFKQDPTENEDGEHDHLETSEENEGSIESAAENMFEPTNESEPKEDLELPCEPFVEVVPSHENNDEDKGPSEPPVSRERAVDREEHVEPNSQPENDQDSSIAENDTMTGERQKNQPEEEQDENSLPGNENDQSSQLEFEVQSESSSSKHGEADAAKMEVAGCTTPNSGASPGETVGHNEARDCESSHGDEKSTLRAEASVRSVCTSGSESTTGLADFQLALFNSSWSSVERILKALSKDPGALLSALLSTPKSVPALGVVPKEKGDRLVAMAEGSLGSGKGATSLHAISWKAPPSLTLRLIPLLLRLPSDKMTQLFMLRDNDGNTPLHLCAANSCVPLQQSPIGIEDDKTIKDEKVQSLRKTSIEVLKGLIRLSPACLAMQNNEGDTPLHLAVSTPHSVLDVVKVLTESSKNAELTMQDCIGATPLHAAIANGADNSVLSLLLEACPGAAFLEDKRGMLPLHYVAGFSHTPVSLLRRLSHINPDALVHQTANGDTPLNLAIANSATMECDWRKQTVQCLLHLADGAEWREQAPTNPMLICNREKSNPLHCCALFDAPPHLTELLMTSRHAEEASQMRHSTGATPLHLAVARSNVVVATVVALGSPQTASAQDGQKRTPLHVASQNTNSPGEIIGVLVELYPKAVSTESQRKNLPLHLAAQSGSSEDVVKVLLNADPDTAAAVNKSKNTPLHDAVKNRAPLAVVRLLAEAFPQGMSLSNQYGNLPLHSATAQRCDEEVIKFLLKAHAEGALVPNKALDLPLHYAAAYTSSENLIRSFVDAAPTSVAMRNANGLKPRDRAERNSNATTEILRLLEVGGLGKIDENGSRTGSVTSLGSCEAEPTEQVVVLPTAA